MPKNNRMEENIFQNKINANTIKSVFVAIIIGKYSEDPGWIQNVFYFSF